MLGFDMCSFLRVHGIQDLEVIFLEWFSNLYNKTSSSKISINYPHLSKTSPHHG